MIGQGKLDPAILVTHIGGLNVARETTLNLPNVPGGKKLIYNKIEMPLTAIEEFGEAALKDKRFGDLDDICKAHNGLWCTEAEEYILNRW